MTSFNVTYNDVKYYFDLKQYSKDDAIREISHLFRQNKIRTPYSKPTKVKLNVFKFVSLNGTLQEQLVDTIEIPIPLNRITSEEFEAEKLKIFEEYSIKVPEIISFIEYKSYEDGHSSGMEEVISYIRSNCSELSELFLKLKIDISSPKISIKK